MNYASAALLAISEGVVVQLASGEIVSCNPAAERILGLTRDQMAGRTSIDPCWRAIREDGSAFPGETHPAMVTLRTGEALRDVVMGVRRPDGALNWISINSEPIPGRDGQPWAVVTTFMDITARKLIEAEVRRLVAETTAQRDAVGGQRDVARIERDAAKVERETIKGQRDAVEGQRDVARIERDVAKVERDAADDKRDAAEAQRDAADAERDSARTERDAADDKRDLAEGRRDVAENRRDIAEEQLRQLNQQLEIRIKERTTELVAANAALESFSYSVSHDLRAPLRAIEGFSAIVETGQGEHLDAEGHRLLGLVRANALRMSKLIDDLLTFSRAGRSRLQRTRVAMSAMARNAFDEVAADPLTRAKIDFRLGELPEAEGDASLLQQVWINLLSNSVKYSAHVEQPVIEVDGVTEGDLVIYRVRDNGAGFDMAYAGKLFGVFQRLHGATEFEGTGIGLALVSQIVTRHGGRVWGEGAVGTGATFSFSLPAEAPRVRLGGSV